jgi:NAD(P)-dependent dehydrogenase (short-subunit alcohol dehydrogenase family)
MVHARLIFSNLYDYFNSEKDVVLTGKTVLVTGAARGIGKAIALRLAADGADVAVVDACHDSPGIDYPMSGFRQLEETRDEIIKLGRRSVAIQADVTRADDVKRMVDGVVKDWGRLDILVNNAGVSASCQKNNGTGS